MAKRVLVAPLDWGLGHATRCIPLIRCLLENKAEVIIAADGRPGELLKREFPGLEHVALPGYNIRYPAKGSMALKMLTSAPRILAGAKKEHQLLEEIVRERKINAVISDNRFGCWSGQVKSIFITHQLKVRTPVASAMLRRMNYRFIINYDACWIPDEGGEPNLSGELSHGFPLPGNAVFIGPLSRLQPVFVEVKKYDVLAILSGPEPQRSIFEDILLKQLQSSPLRSLVVRGVTEEQGSRMLGNCEIVPSLGSAALSEAIASSGIIVSRPGYSTIMDLAAVGGKAVFVPTPGQTEQEYLAENLLQKKVAFSQKQKHFDLVVARKRSEGFSGFRGGEGSDAYQAHVQRFLDSL